MNNNNDKTIFQRLNEIQTTLKAPKAQFNSFSKFNYRSIEDILEAAKKFLLDDEFILLSDDVVMIGERYYTKATATFCKGADSISSNGFAREQESKKGMDVCQISGSCSSYSRKYALAGLLMLDDGKDADSMNNRDNEPASITTNKLTEQSYHNKVEEKHNFILDKNAEQWITCIRSGSHNLSDINDVAYRAFIENHI